MSAFHDDHRATESGADRLAFAWRLHALLARTSPRPPELDEAALALRFDDRTIYRLDGIYHEYRQLPSHQRERGLLLIAQLLRAPQGLVPPEHWHEASSAVVLRLAPSTRGDLALLRQELGLGGDAEGTLARLDLTDTVSVHLAYTDGRALGLLGEHHLADWQVTSEDALRTAVQNLARTQSDPFGLLEPGTWASAVGDWHDGARVLLTEHIAGLDVTGEPVALPAARDLLVVTGSADPYGLLTMLRLAGTSLEMAGFVTTWPMVLRGGRWHPWDPPAADPLRAAFREVHLAERERAYSAQKALLTAWIARCALSLEVADFRLDRHPLRGTPCSTTRWPQAGGFVPEADLVAVPAQGDRWVWVPWSALLQVCGPTLTRSGRHRPPLWRVESLPTGDLRASLSACAIASHEVAG